MCARCRDHFVLIESVMNTRTTPHRMGFDFFRSWVFTLCSESGLDIQLDASLRLLLFGPCEARTWDCVDFRRGVIRINKQLQKRPLRDGGLMFTSLKNGKGRFRAIFECVSKMMLSANLSQAVQYVRGFLK